MSPTRKTTRSDDTALEQHLRATLGVRFAERLDSEPAKRPIREIVGVDPRLNQRWSSRRAHINVRHGEPPGVAPRVTVAEESCDRAVWIRRARAGAGQVAYGGPVELWTGRGAAFVGHLDEAVEDLQTAVEVCSANGAVGYLVEAQYELASALARLRRPGDITRAVPCSPAVRGGPRCSE